METKNKSSAVTVMNMFDSSTMVIFGIYVLFISKNWFYIEIATFILSILSFIGILIVMPESPKWLLINGKQKEAHESLKAIAATNDVPYTIPSDAVFIE
jgi:hypothetical protein